MAITDAERHRLHTKLDQVLGEEDAAVLISHLPPSGWSDVVRTRDLNQIEARINDRFERLEERMDGRFSLIEARFERLEERMDSRFALLEARMDDRDERMDGRFGEFEERTEGRFATTDKGIEAAIERAMRQQTNRFVVFLGVAVTAVITMQQILDAFS